jgi:membrane associated rhomboid family serine protease
MDRLLARLERWFGRWAIENLTLFIVGGMAVVYVLGLARPAFLEALVLDLGAVKHGQVWRLFTYLFVPTTTSPIWIIFSLLFFLSIGTSLEREWGAFKYNFYYVLGMVGTTVAAWLAGGSAGNSWLNWSLIFAYATTFPEQEVYFFFVPIRTKWIGIVGGAFFAYTLATSDWTTRAAILAALSNYFVFFSGTLVATLRMRRQAVRRAALREAGAFDNGDSPSEAAAWRPRAPQPSSPPPRNEDGDSPPGLRTCVLCGAAEEDGADIRVCPCAVCRAATGGRPRTLCLQHARNHDAPVSAVPPPRAEPG